MLAIWINSITWGYFLHTCKRSRSAPLFISYSSSFDVVLISATHRHTQERIEIISFITLAASLQPFYLLPWSSSDDSASSSARIIPSQIMLGSMIIPPSHYRNPLHHATLKSGISQLHSYNVPWEWGHCLGCLSRMEQANSLKQSFGASASGSGLQTRSGG